MDPHRDGTFNTPPHFWKWVLSVNAFTLAQAYSEQIFQLSLYTEWRGWSDIHNGLSCFSFYICQNYNTSNLTVDFNWYSVVKELIKPIMLLYWHRWVRRNGVINIQVLHVHSLFVFKCVADVMRGPTEDVETPVLTCVSFQLCACAAFPICVFVCVCVCVYILPQLSSPRLWLTTLPCNMTAVKRAFTQTDGEQFAVLHGGDRRHCRHNQSCICCWRE